MEERKKYPIGQEHYTLFEEVGNGASASVYRAQCNSLNEIVAIKILDFERHNCDVNNVSREAQTMVLVDHPNVLKSHCSFVNDHNLWVVMPYMTGGSCLHILKAAHPDGFEEVVIATILREALKGLDYLHQHGHIHRDVKAGNILIDSRGGIKLGDFGVSAYLFDSGDRQRIRNTFVGTPCWMAPEVMEQVHGYDFKADIWSFGITALELAHGHAPFSKYPPMKVLLMTLQNAPPGLDYERDQKFSKSFRHMIASCLVKDPSKRPSAKKLLKHSFFKQARSNDYIARTLLKGLPALGDLLQELKRREEDMVAQKKMPDGEKEEISQNEYKRGISGWNFNLDDMKAQASLIQDDDLISEKDESIQTKQAEHEPSSSRQNEIFQHQLSFASRSDTADSDESGPSLSSADSLFSVPKCSKVDDNGGLSGSIPEHVILSPVKENRIDIVRKKPQEASLIGSNQRGNPGTENNRSQNQSEIFVSTGLANPLDLIQPEVQSKSTKSSVNGDDGDDKNKSPVVQRKSRFKVTSENVDMVDPALILKGSSVQLSENLVSKVIAQLPTSVTPLSEDATSSDNSGLGSFFNLQLMLYANIIQRDFLIALLKQTSSNDPSDCTQASMETVEKTLLEAANEREKDLLREVSDLQLRLICAQEEIKKYKTENGRANS